jgi:hypothetical protein
MFYDYPQVKTSKCFVKNCFQTFCRSLNSFLAAKNGEVECWLYLIMPLFVNKVCKYNVYMYFVLTGNRALCLDLKMTNLFHIVLVYKKNCLCFNSYVTN